MSSTSEAVALGVQPVAVKGIRITAYRSVPKQTDSSPYITSLGHRVSQQGVAVSPDLMESGEICYGDVVILPSSIPAEGMSARVVNDVTHPRLKRTTDVWVSSYSMEKRMGIRKQQSVVVVKSPNRFCEK